MIRERLETAIFRGEDQPDLSPGSPLWWALALAGLLLVPAVIFAGVVSIPLFLGLVAGLAALAALFTKPAWGVVIILLLTTIRRFFAVLVGSFGVFTVNRTLALWLFIAILLHRYVFRTRGPFHPHPQNRLILLYGMWYTICTITALSFVHSAYVWPNMISNLGLFFLIYQLVDDELKLRVLFIGYVVMLGCSGVISLVGLRLTGHRLFGEAELAGAEGGTTARLEGMAGMLANNFAVLLVLCILALAVLIFWKDLKRWQRGLLLGLEVSFMILLAQTLSRTGMLLFLIAAAVFIFRFRKRIGTTRLLAGAGIVIVLLTAVASKDLVTRFASISKVKDLRLSEDQSISNRIGLTLLLPRIVAINPVFGIGPGNFPYLTSQIEYREFVARNITGRGYKSHNQYAQLIGETGFIGLAIFITIIAACIKDLIACRRLVVHSEGSFLWCLVEALTMMIPLLLLAAATLEVATKPSTWLIFALPIIARRLLERKAAETPLPAA